MSTLLGIHDWAELNLAQAFRDRTVGGGVVSCLVGTGTSSALGRGATLFARLGATIDQPHTYPKAMGKRNFSR